MKILITILLMIPIFSFGQTPDEIIVRADSMAKPYQVDALSHVREILNSATLVGKGISKESFISSYNSSLIAKHIGVETTVPAIVATLKKNGNTYARMRFLEAKSRFLAKLKYDYIKSKK